MSVNANAKRPDWAGAPEWANWLAQDENGKWFWFEREPKPVGNKFDADGLIAHARTDGSPSPLWEMTKEERRPFDEVTPEEDEEWQAMGERQKRSKYHVQIRPGVYVDVYDVLHAFGVTNPGDQHAIKKMLMPGKRGHKDAIQDRREAIQSLEWAIELEGGQ